MDLEHGALNSTQTSHSDSINLKQFSNFSAFHPHWKGGGVWTRCVWGAGGGGLAQGLGGGEGGSSSQFRYSHVRLAPPQSPQTPVTRGAPPSDKEVLVHRHESGWGMGRAHTALHTAPHTAALSPALSATTTARADLNSGSPTRDGSHHPPPRPATPLIPRQRFHPPLLGGGGGGASSLQLLPFAPDGPPLGVLRPEIASEPLFQPPATAVDTPSHALARLTLEEGRRRGLGPKGLCTKNGPTRFSRLQISFPPSPHGRRFLPTPGGDGHHTTVT